MTEQRKFWAPPPMWLALPLSAVLMLGVAVGAWMLAKSGQEAVDAKEAVSDAAVPMAVTVEQLCTAGGDVARALDAAGQCEQAKVVQREAARVGGTPRVVTIKPDRGELLGFVRNEVETYCAGRNDCRPDAGVLVELVANYLRQNPPEPGRPPSPEEIAAAARAVLTADPALFQGAQGEKGDQGDGPTDEQVLAQVAAFCSDGRCRGERGEPGGQGPGVAEFYFSRNEAGQCEAVVVFVDPPSGQTRTERRAAGDAACAPVVPPADGGLLGGG
jgi:hypothetical protein